MTITVERDRSVVVLAPESASDETIRRMVDSKRQWIYEKIGHSQKYHSFPNAPGKELVNGESALYLGRQYRIQIIESDSVDIAFTQGFLVPASRVDRHAGAMREWYMTRAREKILPRIQRHARMLGVKFKRARIVDNRYRWGSCTVQDNVNINWRLIKAPMFVIDYVIVHELTHLIESNHTPRFWNIVRTQLPAMDKAHGWLSEHGEILEEEL